MVRLAMLAVASTLFSGCIGTYTSVSVKEKETAKTETKDDTQSSAATTEQKSTTAQPEEATKNTDQEKKAQPQEDKTSASTPSEESEDKNMTTAKKTIQKGLEYEILREPQSDAQQVERGNLVSVHYTGWLQDEHGKKGKEFDSSFRRNQTLTFRAGTGRVIQGWDKILLDMKEGEKRLVTISPELAYGARGAGAAIPPNSTLIFEIDLCSVKKS